MANVTSTPGDCFNSIAKAQGFFNYRTIYNFSDNATTFPNPNMLQEGSTVKVPDKQMKAYDVTLDDVTKFKILRKKTKIKIKICKADTADTPRITKATLVVGAKKADNRTGTLEIDDIDASVTNATLTLVLSDPASYAAPAKLPAPVANQYPPAIVVADFDDPKTIWPAKGQTIVWNLMVGSLEPFSVIRGVLQRLENLGFTCPIQLAEDAATQSAVKTYQRFVLTLNPPADTGVVADIRANIKTRHDD